MSHRVNPAPKLLSPAARLKRAIKILGPKAKPSVEEALASMAHQFRLWKADQRAKSVPLQRSARSYRSALQTVIRITEKGPHELRVAMQLIPFTKTFINNEVFDHDRLIRDLTVLHQAAKKIEVRETPFKPRPSARDKDLAAHYALRLCVICDVKLTTTKKVSLTNKPSTFLQLAAILFGDPKADLQHQCRRELAAYNARALASTSEEPAQK